ncbi:hypothetical protein [Paenibacillus ehimensis]|uniref:hypothetical protein n=1 Tax=Paenibacillus ehimensis TaxID=79264 RepID=UPI001268FD97|nr:hypothetical protein [Paenibacillus ehimensis]
MSLPSSLINDKGGSNMSDGIASLYAACTGTELFLMIEKLFLQQGIGLITPCNGFVKMLDENYDIGDYSRDDLLENLAQNDQVSFQWWWGEGEDLYCRVRNIDQLSIIELGIEHTTKDQTEKIVRSFLEIFQNYRDIVIGFILDRRGYLNANNYNIDKWFVGQNREIHDFGIILGIDSKEEMTLTYDAQQIADITKVIQESVVLGTKDESREIIIIFGC